MFHLHFKVGLAIDTIDKDVIELEVTLDHLDLRVGLFEFLVDGVSIEDYNLEVLWQVAEAVNSAYADPHVAWCFCSRIHCRIRIILRICQLLQVLLWHDMILLGRYTSIFEEIAEDALKTDDNDRVV